MTDVLLDTHTLVWNLDEPVRLGAAARAAIEAAARVEVSPISFYEIGQKARLGRWAEAAPLLPRIKSVFLERGGRLAALSAELCLAAATLDWPHRDPFDRIIAATALAGGLILVSADAGFDGLPGLRRVW
ncbi:MAG: type II toxin-antitoxin system VapC family toxin [Rhodobacteraceae bacterium]|nr:type II toxin-antitoxin system VapC family toxin [Paracoccaceae bacterium]